MGGKEKDGIIMQCWFNREYNIHNESKVSSGPVKQFTCKKRIFFYSAIMPVIFKAGLFAIFLLT
jgi:hypothetical protein